MNNDHDHPTTPWQDDPRLTAYALHETGHLT